MNELRFGMNNIRLSKYRIKRRTPEMFTEDNNEQADGNVYVEAFEEICDDINKERKPEFRYKKDEPKVLEFDRFIFPED